MTTTPIRPESNSVEQRSQHVRKWKQYTDWADVHPDVSCEDITVQFVREGRLPPEWISLDVDGEFDKTALSDWISNGFREGTYGRLDSDQFALAYYEGVLYRNGDYVATVKDGEWRISRIVGFNDRRIVPTAALTATERTPMVHHLTVDIEQCFENPPQQRPTPDATSSTETSRTAGVENTFGASRDSSARVRTDSVRPRVESPLARDSTEVAGTLPVIESDIPVQPMIRVFGGCAASLCAIIGGLVADSQTIATGCFVAAIVLLVYVLVSICANSNYAFGPA